MYVGIKATFEKRIDAKKALNELEDKLGKSDSVVKFYDLGKKSLDWSKENIKMSDFARYNIVGGLIGFVFGFVLMQVLKSTTDLGLMENWNTFLFTIPFLAMGVVCSSIVFFIRRENVISISEDDIEGEEAVISIFCQNQIVEKFERILLKNHADHIFVS